MRVAIARHICIAALAAVGLAVGAWGTEPKPASQLTELADPAAAVPPVVNLAPGPEYSDQTRMFQGIPGIERAAGGRPWATWYGGGVAENHHNYVLLDTSGDDGRTWKRALLIDPDGDGPMTCLKPCFGAVGAEHSLAAMLTFSRRLNHPHDGPMTMWHGGYDDAKPVELAGATVGIIGMGQMGLALAQRAAAMGMRVLGVARTARETPAHVDQLFTPDQFDQVLPQCDYVAICVPVTSATVGMVDVTFLKQMKSSAYLIDTSGRPPLIDFAALHAAIDEGAIAGVSLQPGGGDVVGLPGPDDTFWRKANVVVTSCRATSEQILDNATDLVFENLRLLEAGEPLLGLVDKQAGY